MTRARRKTKEAKNQLGGVFFQSFQPKTQNQRDYIQAVSESDLTIVSGPAGTGKSFQAIGLGCQYLLEGRYKNILYTRSIISCDNEIGFLKGSLEEKLEPHFMSAIDYFHYFIGKAKTESLISYGNLKFFPVELIRGQTHNDTLMIIDECQNITKKQLKLFMTRMGKGSKMIVLGDERQSDIGPNGFEFCINKMQDVTGVSIIKLDRGDIMRHPILGDVIAVFENNGI